MAASVNNTLLPINATEFERALESAAARISDVPVLVRESWNPDTCAPPLLPWLADCFSVDTWEPAWSDPQKRATIKDSVFVHRHKGTIGAVRRSLKALGLEVQVQEWFQQTPPAAPFTFRLLLTADQVGYTKEAIARVGDVVDATKNLRSHISALVPQAVTHAGPTVAAVTCLGAETTIIFDEAGFALMLEGAVNGTVPTEQAVDLLHTLLHSTMPAVNYW